MKYKDLLELPKLDVAGSIPVIRSDPFRRLNQLPFGYFAFGGS